MGGACPSRASVVPLGGWYSERRLHFHVKVEVSVSDDIPGGLRGSGQLIPPNRVKVRFAHNPGKLQGGTIQPDGSIKWDNGKTWAYGDARAQRWAPPQPDAPSSAAVPPQPDAPSSATEEQSDNAAGVRAASSGWQDLFLDLDHAQALAAAGLPDDGSTRSESFLDARREVTLPKALTGE